MPIVKILAYDKDAGINSEIRYNWDENNDLTQRHLKLNTKTGEIFPQRLFSFSYDSILSKEEVRQVKVYATDGDGRRSSVSANIYLYLNVDKDGDDGFKVFQETKLAFSIVEDNSLDSSFDTISQTEGKPNSMHKI